MQIDVKEITNCSCETTQDFTHGSSPHHNTGFNLHGIKSSQETNKHRLQVTINIWTSPHWKQVWWEPVHMGGTSDCSCCSRSSSLSGGSEDSAQPRSSWLWVDLSQANPQAKTGTLLIHRQQEVNLEEAHEDDQCLTKARLHSILVDCWRVIKICQFPVSCTCSVEGQAMIWRSSPLYSSTSKACSLRKTCWMLFCGRGGKIPSSYWVLEEN